MDVAIVGAPTDDLVSDRPGTRFGPRAIRGASCPSGPHLEAGVDAFEVLRVVDFGDAAVLPAEPVKSHEAIEALVGQVVDAGALPVILGGDHSIAEPDIRAIARRRGPVGLIHFDTHTDTGETVFGAALSHGTIMYRLVEQGWVDPTRYVADRAAGLLAGRGRVHVAARARHHELLHARRAGDRHPRRHLARDRHRGGRPGVLERGRRRARPGVRARHGHAGAGRDDVDRPAVGLPAGRRARGAVRDGRRWRSRRRRSARPTSPRWSRTGSCARR